MQGGKAKLPFSSGAILSLQSDKYGLYCNVGGRAESPPWTMRCNEEAVDTSPAHGLLVLGKSFMTADILDGGSIYIKSQKENKFCSVGPADQGSYIVCHQIHYGKTSEFVVELLDSDGSIRIRPAADPEAWCHATRDHREAKEVHHLVRCGGSSSLEAQTFVTAGTAQGGGGAGGGGYPSGGGDWPSGGGDWPSGGSGDWPSGAPDGDGGSSGGYPSGGGSYWPSGGDDGKSRGRGEGGDDWMPGEDGSLPSYDGDIPDEWPTGGSEQGGDWYPA